MEQRKYSNSDLLKKILIGGIDLEEAFRDLMISEKNSRTIQRLIVRRGGSLEDYEEIFNDTMLALHKGIITGRFKDDSKISQYMTRTARNLLFRKFKKNKAKFSEIDHSIMDLSPSIEDNIIKKERKNILIGVIRRLGLTCQEILIKAFIENYKNKELQKIFDYKNDGVVRKVKSDCLRKLRLLLREDPMLTSKLNIS